MLVLSWSVIFAIVFCDLFIAESTIIIVEDAKGNNLKTNAFYVSVMIVLKRSLFSTAFLISLCDFNI